MKEIARAFQKVADHPVLLAFINTVIMVPLLILAINEKSSRAAIALMIYFMVLLGVAIYSDSCRKSSKKNLVYDSSSGVVTVVNRSSANHYVLDVDRYFQPTLKYKPATATYTAATVGGVTTGGLDVKEAHYEQGAKTTKKYAVVYRTDDKYLRTQPYAMSFILNDIDLQIAKSNPFLSEFVRNSGKANFLAMHKPEDGSATKAGRAYYKNTGDIYGAMALSAQDYTDAMLTETEARRVVDFLCGSNDP